MKNNDVVAARLTQGQPADIGQILDGDVGHARTTHKMTACQGAIPQERQPETAATGFEGQGTRGVEGHGFGGRKAHAVCNDADARAGTGCDAVGHTGSAAEAAAYMTVQSL